MRLKPSRGLPRNTFTAAYIPKPAACVWCCAPRDGQISHANESVRHAGMPHHQRPCPLPPFPASHPRRERHMRPRPRPLRRCRLCCHAAPWRPAPTCAKERKAALAKCHQRTLHALRQARSLGGNGGQNIRCHTHSATPPPPTLCAGSISNAPWHLRAAAAHSTCGEKPPLSSRCLDALVSRGSLLPAAWPAPPPEDLPAGRRPKTFLPRSTPPGECSPGERVPLAARIALAMGSFGSASALRLAALLVSGLPPCCCCAACPAGDGLARPALGEACGTAAAGAARTCFLSGVLDGRCGEATGAAAREGRWRSGSAGDAHPASSSSAARFRVNVFMVLTAWRRAGA